MIRLATNSGSLGRVRLSRKQEFYRLREILEVVWRAGGNVLVEHLRLRFLVPLRCRIHCALHRRHPSNCLARMQESSLEISPQVLREVLESLGPTFIKLGQVLSLRADVVGADLARELSALQSDVPPFPFREVERVVCEEFDAPIEELFKSFEETPVAAASLSQVHRAKLHTGQTVAVKVQRPEIERIIKLDHLILKHLADAAHRHMPSLKIYDLPRFVQEFAEWTLDELDFRIEGHNADRFGALFADNPHINIPSIYWEQTGRRVLTMDFVHGLKVDDLKGMRRRHIHGDQLALHGAQAMFQQFFMEGFFHADPHPGNFFALKHDVLCLHDFGMVGRLRARQRHTLLQCIAAFIVHDADAFIRHFTSLAETDLNSDLPGYEKDLDRILTQLYYSGQRVSLAWSFFQAINAGARRGVRFPADLALFGKAIVTTESMGLALYPEFKLDEELKTFARKTMQAYVERMADSWRASAIDLLDIIETLPERARKILVQAERGEFRLRLDLPEEAIAHVESTRKHGARLFLGLLVAIFLALVFAVVPSESRFAVSPFSLMMGVGLSAFAYYIFGQRGR